MRKRVLMLSRIRSITPSFAFIPHRFVTDGFIGTLGQSEILLYLFLSLVSDARGLSFYSDRTICKLLEIALPMLQQSRDNLLHTDLIAFEAPLYQVLELPDEPVIILENRPYPMRPATRRTSFSDLRLLMGEDS